MNFKAIIYNNDTANPGWILFENPVQVISVDSIDDIIGSILDIETNIQNGYYAVGYIGYEAASAFDSALIAKNPVFPLMTFGIYKDYKEIILPDTNNFVLSEMLPNISKAEYDRKIRLIKEYIASGDTYQVNYTYKLKGTFHGDLLELFSYLNDSQQSIYSAFLQSDDIAILSVSPELFFAKEGSKLYCKPMKGTSPRENSFSDDIKRASWLQQSEKNRAENLMIVDMVRNDLGKISEIGSINTKLFKIEKYQSVWQMTSDVNAISSKSILEIFRALFPSASITGAPKVHTMTIINELEDVPREVYTGSIGIIKPDGDAIFNVAIRTALIDLKSNVIEYGVGGGITWDSTTDDEYEETIHKALIITEDKKRFSLFETMLWKKDDGIFLLDYHMKRLIDSAEYFGFNFDLLALKDNLDNLQILTEKAVIRIELEKTGNTKIELKEYPEHKSEIWQVKVSKKTICSNNRMLYHKTTDRRVYDDIRKEYSDFDDVICINENGEVTESSIANIVIMIDHNLYTPPVKCGLLNGTYRQYLLDNNEIAEMIITVDTLHNADKVYLINSVRGWIPVQVNL